MHDEPSEQTASYEAERGVNRQPLGQRVWESVSFAAGLLGPLQNHAAAYLPLEDSLAIVGGRDSATVLAPLTKWYGIDLAASMVWSFRALDRVFGASAAYDPSMPRLLVFGGRSSVGAASASLLQIDLRNGLASTGFEELRASGDRPAARYHHAAAFDPDRGWLVVYGGVADEGQPISESVTWVYDTTTARWASLAGASVGQRVGAVMVYDARHRTMLLVGGSARGPRDVDGSIHALVCSDAPTVTPGATVTIAATSTPAATATPTATDPPTALPTPTATDTPAAPGTPAATDAPTASATAAATPVPRATPTTVALTPAPQCRVCWIPFGAR